VSAILSLLAADVLAYGAAGHLTVGRVAETLLCADAKEAVRRLARGSDLGEVGLWADRQGRSERYSYSAPWHFVNIELPAPVDIGDALQVVADFEHPPEGDVLSALEDLYEQLENPDFGRRDRLTALRFFVHFVADVHQPLHVGRADDRGGNRIDVVLDGEVMNLHFYWDTAAIEENDLDLGEIEAIVARLVDPADVAAPFDPASWVAEGLTLRDEVYAFGRDRTADGAVRLPARYRAFARELSLPQLGKAAARLAGALNSLYCN
jgi:hypothetical protein